MQSSVCGIAGNAYTNAVAKPRLDVGGVVYIWKNEFGGKTLHLLKPRPFNSYHPPSKAYESIYFEEN